MRVKMLFDQCPFSLPPRLFICEHAVLKPKPEQLRFPLLRQECPTLAGARFTEVNEDESAGGILLISEVPAPGLYTRLLYTNCPRPSRSSFGIRERKNRFLICPVAPVISLGWRLHARLQHLVLLNPAVHHGTLTSIAMPDGTQRTHLFLWCTIQKELAADCVSVCCHGSASAG